jgi:glycogen debranching enzyme
MSLIDQTNKEAIMVLKNCITPRGIYASGSENNYQAVWARDAFVSLLGGSLAGEEFKAVFEKSLNLMVKHQSELGQIPNCVGDYNIDRKSEVTFATMDSSLWFIIAEFVYAKNYNSQKLLKKHRGAIEKTALWIKYQDSGEDHLPEQQPTTDWQDAFPHKYGHILSTQALYYFVLKLLGQKKEAETVKKIINGQARQDMKMFDAKRGYYLPWIWKNHDGDREEGHWFDSLGNLLAILTGLADDFQANKILNYIEKNKVNLPFPVKAINPPIYPDSPDWHSYFNKCDARTPYNYLNAGVWPYLGGFYVASLVKMKQYKKAEKELNKLALANELGVDLPWGFNEWIDGVDGKPKGSRYQAWSAGMYLFAYECVKKKRVPIF